MQVPKIHLSSSELELMQDATVILTKNRVLEKTKYMLETVQQLQIEFIRNKGLQQDEIYSTGPKISKGENYMGLPYLILDYPRVSAPGKLFFIRSMFWWGNFFSSTLHLSGSFRIDNMERIKKSHAQLTDHYIGINKDPWVHHFDETNYRKVGDLTRNEFETYFETTEHLKIAARWPLSAWDDAPSILFEHWKFLMGCRH